MKLVDTFTTRFFVPTKHNYYMCCLLQTTWMHPTNQPRFFKIQFNIILHLRLCRPILHKKLKHLWYVLLYIYLEAKNTESDLWVFIIHTCQFSVIIRWAGHVTRMGEGKAVHRVLVGKPEGKRSLGRPRRRLVDNIKMDLQEVGGVVGTGWSWLRIGTGGGHF